ncbi:MAG: hypothetical protein K2W94_08510 [Alphaproteobacteria bacterium]|nr:hypothetical protein [Alphaproteobacteria bacterium]
MFNPLNYLYKGLHKLFKKNLLYGISLYGRSTSELITIPTDPWPGHFQTAQRLLDGSFPIDGQLIPLKECLPYLAMSKICPPILLSRLHSFEWLRDLRTINTNPSRKFARELVSHWIDYNHSITKKSWLTPAWKNGITGSRLANWVALYDFFGVTANDSFRQAFFKSLIRQYRYLRRNYSIKEDPLEAFLSLKGLIFCACTLPRQKHRIPGFLKDLEFVSKKQLLPDGGHVSRSPLIQFILLRDLIDIRLLLKGAELEDPLFMQQAIHAMAPLVRLFRHGDGGLASFMGNNDPYNMGIGAENISPGSVDMALSLADVRGRPPGRAPYIGIERCTSKAGLVLLNAKPSLYELPPFMRSEEPGINILDFEWSSGRQRIINRSDVVVQLADHSWLQIKDIDEAQPVIKRHNKDGNGYIEAELEKTTRGLVYHHKRQLYLAPEEGDFRGHDTLTVSESSMGAVRFIFSNTVDIVSDAPQRIRIRTRPSGEEINLQKKIKHLPQIWRFIASGCENIICQTSPETGLSYLLLLVPLSADKAQTLKWAFRLEVGAIE